MQITTSIHITTFTDKETGCETGFSYFGARYCDPTLLTYWTAADPMADKYPSLSPYNYCHWNPLKLVDRTGMCADGWQLELTTGLWTKTDLRGGVEFLSGLTGAASFAAASGSRELSFSLMSNGLSTTNLIFGGLIDERW